MSIEKSLHFFYIQVIAYLKLETIIGLYIPEWNITWTFKSITLLVGYTIGYHIYKNLGHFEWSQEFGKYWMGYKQHWEGSGSHLGVCVSLCVWVRGASAVRLWMEFLNTHQPPYRHWQTHTHIEGTHCTSHKNTHTGIHTQTNNFRLTHIHKTQRQTHTHMHWQTQSHIAPNSQTHICAKTNTRTWTHRDKWAQLCAKKKKQKHKCKNFLTLVTF